MSVPLASLCHLADKSVASKNCTQVRRTMAMNHHALDGDSPSVPIQPRPVLTRSVQHENRNGNWTTSVYREWKPGDVQRCTLCRVCCAHHDGCLLVFDGRIGGADSALVTDDGFDRATPESVPSWTSVR